MMTACITQSQLESYFWGAATLKRGYIDEGDYKQYIFPLLFFKRLCDVYDAEVPQALKLSGGDREYALFPEKYRFQIPPMAHWRMIRQVSRHADKLSGTHFGHIDARNSFFSFRHLFLMISTVREGKEPQGHARKRLEQAAWGLNKAIQ